MKNDLIQHLDIKPGVPCLLAKNYFDELKRNGWDYAVRRKLEIDVLPMQSFLVQPGPDSFEDILTVCTYPEVWPPHRKFVMRLQQYVRSLTLAALGESLRDLATSGTPQERLRAIEIMDSIWEQQEKHSRQY